MQRLTEDDFRRVLSFLDEAEGMETDEPFSPEFLSKLCRLVESDWVGFEEKDRLRRECLGASAFPEFAGGDLGDASSWIHDEHPVLHYQDMTGDFRAHKVSDFLTRRELRRSRFYAEWLRVWGVEHHMGVGLDAPPWHTKIFLFDRFGGRDFSERDRAVLDMLRPHLAQLYRAAQTRRRLREALALYESTQAGVVLLEAGDRVAFANAAARDLLERYFGETGVRLPGLLASWLRDRRRAPAGTPLRVDAGDRSLVVDFVGGGLLLEERTRLPRLTPREREILDLVAEGKTNAEIGETLWVSPGTVRRHVENVFAKLGVHTRTAAAAFVHERRLPFRTADVDT
jgi:DNA-binding CsgD family transcriptional regulator